MLPAGAPSRLRALRIEGRRSVAQIVDGYGIECRPVRDLLVEYFTERAPELDHTSLRSIARNLCRLFWRDLEIHHPGIDSLQLPPQVAQAWKERLAYIRDAAGRPVRPRVNYRSELVFVRAFYEDIALSMTLFKEETMFVQPVVIPGSGTLSWTMLGDDDVPVVPVDRFLAYLTDIGRSPNTVKAYAHDLKDFWECLARRGLDWREARLEDVGEFVAWLQLPPAGRSGVVAALPSAVPQVSVATVNRKLAAVSAFYAHQARNVTGPGDLLAAWRTGGRGGWKPFLHHVSKGKPYRGRAISLKAPAKLPRILTATETQAILDACTRLRDRFFFALLHETGCRAGEALGLRHEDIAAAEREISVVPQGERERRPGQVRRPDGPGRRRS